MTAAPTWLTATPPTPNGDLHLGHLAGPYLAVDVLRRFLAAEGTPVRMTTGLDDHQSYVPVRGLLSERTGAQVADGYGERIRAAWTAAGIDFDTVVLPREQPGYTDFVQRFFAELHRQGAIVPRTRPLPYCEPCGRWLYEAYLVGSCPHCGESSNGNACEPCGRPNECGDLGDPHCVVCGSAAVPREQTRLFLPLAPFAERLAAFWAEVDMPPHLRALCETMAAAGLPEIAVSHPGDWGVPVPVPGFTDQRIYVWFEMAPGYLLEYDPAGERPQRGPVQFFGFDNGYFHAVLFPSLFMAWDGQLPLPSAFVVNEFYRLAGKKFSTSRRHAVWALDALAEHDSDTLRYQLLRDRPNGRQSSFEHGDLEQARRHLDREWNGWLRRLLAAVRQECDSVAPAEQPAGPAWELLRGRLERTADELREAYSVRGFDPRRALDLLDEAVRCVRDFGHVQAHEPDPAARRAALAAQLAAASALAAWAAPVLPAGAERLAALLSADPGRPVDAAALTAPAPGTKLFTPDGPVFGAGADV
ncbi:class I tRNA ligase family protein [Kitasatospora sp. NBC_01287]|uniref:class I tRNA ligase family protein n=1 Tax=Kitasatospora sp. NBC_01287 TaxID=2903573 RepID=UPI002259AE78|nr:class I tRNA ligase family protein [Kitasatospora sp. NBC_01287]MCX4746939.1 class I tRNA ligase family protein [Kitasatospora sp. NBC_01287]